MPGMVDPKTGEAFDVPEAESQRATDEFGLVPSEHYATLQKYSSLASQASAAGKLAADTATFGLTGYGDTQEGKEQIGAFKELSPTLGAVTEMAAAAGTGALAGGGAGLAMRGLGLSTRAAQIGGVVAEEVSQSAALEAQHAREADEGIDVGNVLMGIPLALGVSAAGRLAAGGVRRLRGASALTDVSEDAARMGAREAGAAVPTPSEKLLDNAASPENNALSRGRQTSKARRSVGAAGAGADERPPLTQAEVRRIAEDRPAVHAQVEKLGGDAIEDTVGGEAPTLDAVHNIGLKKADAAGRMTDANPERMLDLADKHITALDEYATQLEGAGQKSAARNVRARINAIGEAYTLADQAPEDMAIALDQSKRTIGNLRSKYGAIRDTTAEALAESSQEIFDSLRVDLEDSKAFGKFWAEKQAGENGLWSGTKTGTGGIIRNGALWQSEFTELAPGAAGRVWKDARTLPVFRMRGDIVQQALAMTDRRFGDVTKAWSRWIDDVEQMSLLKAELGAKSVDSTPVMRLQQSLADMRQTIDELKTLREVEKYGSHIVAKNASRGAGLSQAEQAFEAATQIPGVGGALNAGRRALESVKGRSLFEAPLADVPKAFTREEARAAGAARQKGLGQREPRMRSDVPTGRGGPPSGNLAQALGLDKAGAAVERGARAVSGAPIAGTVGALGAAGAAYSASQQERTPATQALAEISDDSRAISERAALGLVAPPSRPPRLAPLAVRFKENAPDLQTAFLNKLSDLQQVDANPMAFVDGMADTFGAIAHGGHDDLYTQLVQRVQVGTQYLLANAPPSVGISMTRPDGIPPDTLAIMKWASMYNAVFSPGDVVYDVATGDATPTQIKALREVHPDIYGNLRADVLKQVAQVGQKIPFETLRTLDVLFDLPGAGGLAFSDGMASTMASAYAQKGQPSQSLAGESVIAPTSATAALANGPSTLQG